MPLGGTVPTPKNTSGEVRLAGILAGGDFSPKFRR
jgi:hypothetical protein